MRRCAKMWEDVRRCEKMWRWEDEEKMGGWEDVKMRRCEDEKMWRCEDEKMWRWEDVKMRRCEDERMWRWEDVKMRRCEDERMWRWEDVKIRRCEDEKMWRWEGVKMRRCEDEKVWEKVWRWEDVLQTPTIGRTLRSDALGKRLETSWDQILQRITKLNVFKCFNSWLNSPSSFFPVRQLHPGSLCWGLGECGVAYLYWSSIGHWQDMELI